MRLAAVFLVAFLHAQHAEAALRGRHGGFALGLEHLAQFEQHRELVAVAHNNASLDRQQVAQKALYVHQQEEVVRITDEPAKEEDDSISARVWKAGNRMKLPMMNAINVFRAQMCMSRPNMLDHEKCMKFMSKKCAKQTTGAGYCKEYRDKVAAACADGHENACKYGAGMGITADSGGGKDGEGDGAAAIHGDTDGDGDVDKHDALHGDVDGDGDVDAADAGDTDGDGDVDKHNATNGDVDGDGDVDKHNATTFDTDGDGDVDADDRADDAADGAAAASSAPAPAPGPAPGPSMPVIDMDEKRPLPEQGYDEFRNASMVNHDDKVTMTGDWGTEWPEFDETEGQTEERICRDNPTLYWCRLYLKDRKGSLEDVGRAKEADVIQDALDSGDDPDTSV